ncbi:hypothetical protein AMATHDRAFT_8185 [Amanita thiersii Skay4041]|uniref:Uncharacterized protein n=1 Tax=Amanita thiersii Skay4041 TaxID=703135 RepID=A0A2A9NCY4_9AGAR|nr:hypothetical protein AMATHDRAFT_8185 [Amanita thiersii Skay4041]
MPPRFDPQANLPERLQACLDAWELNPPKHQFQAYGPLNAYLQDIKFTSGRFLVEPQPLLRLKTEEALSATDDGADSDTSIDSQGVAVKKKEKKYPDFTICQYFGANIDVNPQADIIHIICEVGSLGTNSNELRQRVVVYLDHVGDHWTGHVLGNGIIGNEVTLVKNNEMQGFNLVKVNGEEWFSMFHSQFVQELNLLHDYCIQNDEVEL